MSERPSSNIRHGEEPALLYYDGDCPFCSRYVRWLRLQRAVGSVHLVNADLFNQLNRLIFSSPSTSKLLYPLLKAARNLVLLIYGRPKIARDRL
jgi:predicted DCC family thiol-disulfide oxidoreductase YuxK